MKKILLLLLVNFCINNANSQWCVPTTVIPYNIDMPGITHVIFNTIDRVSSDLEDFPNNNYTNTGMSTSLVRGMTYDIHITYTIDPNICPDMNLRVWIDYNQNFLFTDAGETALSVDNQLPGTYVGTITIPLTAPLGSTRMRVTAKMTPNGGHTMPTPCDIPADPFGYHGEMEDYDLEITSATSIQNPSASENNFNVIQSDDQINFSFFQKEKSIVSLELFDMEGKMVGNVLPSGIIEAGEHNYEFKTNSLSKGIYFGMLELDGNRISKKIIVE